MVMYFINKIVLFTDIFMYCHITIVTGTYIQDTHLLSFNLLRK